MTPQRNTTSFTIVYAVLALLAVVFLQSLWAEYRAVQPLAYSEFLAQLRNGNVESIAVSANAIEGKLKQPLPDGRDRFVTTRVETDLAAELDRYPVKFSGVIESTLLRDILGWVVSMAVFALIWFFLIGCLQ